MVPYLASFQEVTIAACQIAIATAPVAHHHFGQTQIAPAVASRASVASNQTAAIALEMGCVNWGSSAHPKALAGDQQNE